MISQDIIVFAGLILYVIGAYRTYRWMRKRQENPVVNQWVNNPPWWGVLIAALLGWYLLEVALLLWSHTMSLEEGFEQRYMICPMCEGRPLVTNYQPIWKVKGPYRCPLCGGTGIVTKKVGEAYVKAQEKTTDGEDTDHGR